VDNGTINRKIKLMEITTRRQFGNLVQQFYQKGLGAEIGIEYGHNSNQILEEWKGKIICVDMFVRDEARHLLANKPVQFVQASSVEAAKSVADGALDFVYIDADHDYKNAKQDLLAWFPKVRHGGIVAGHDYLNWSKEEGAQGDFGVKAAVDEFCVKNGYALHTTKDDFWTMPGGWPPDPYQTWWFVKEIPRIIYYTWVNPAPMPEKFQKYIDGWKVLMPDYEIRQISLDNVVKSPFVMDAISRGNYAVAGHYGRCERLLATGGIYFDFDVEAVKRFDDLLGNEFFCASEVAHRVNNAVFGSMPGHAFMKDCLAFMDKIVYFDPGPLGIEIETGPEMFTRIAKKFGWQERDEVQKLDGITVYDSKYFYPYYFDKKYRPGYAKPETYAIHHWAKTW
jgi:hypothetical protein